MGNVSMKNMATGDRVVRAYIRAVRDMTKGDIKLVKATRCAVFAPDGTDDKDTCFQVFVTVVRFSKRQLKDHPESGGMLCQV